jgi:phosphatidylinositol alpha-1,6-mannosyltransferase
MREPRVLVLSPDFPPLPGGIQVLVHRVVSNTTRLTPRVVTLDAPGVDTNGVSDGLDVRRVRTTRALRQLTILSLNAGAVRQAVEFRPDVVLSAHIVTSPAAAAIKHLLRVPFVQYFHAKEIGAKPALARFAARQAEASITVSRYTRELAVGVGGDRERMHRIPPGVDVPETLDRAANGRPTLLTIARLEDRYKGHDVVMRAMPLIRARVPDMQWVIIGDGPLRKGLQRLAAAQGVAGHVLFAGAVSDAERDDWLRQAHVFTMPSRLPAGQFAGEGFGIVYLEANAREIPVVAGHVGGALDAVVDGETGLLVDPTDHVAVAEAIAGLLSDRDRAASLGAAGRARAHEFAWPRIARRVEDLLLDVAGR